MNKMLRYVYKSTLAAGVLLLSASMTMAQLSGDYFIPQGSHSAGFASLGDAFADLNANGASGAVTFYIDGDLDERGNTLVINRTDLSETNSLLIKPSPGTTPTISVARGSDDDGDRTSSTGFSIERAHWVTIDGSNEPGGNSRDLTILLDEDVASLPGTVSILTVYSTVNHISILNTNITHTFGELGRGVLISRSAGQDSVVQNVTIHNSRVGDEDQVLTTAVFLEGVFGLADNPIPEQADLMDNITITDTQIFGTRWCIYVQSASNIEFTGNDCVINGYSAVSTQSQRAGIQLQLAKDANVSGNSITVQDINLQTNVSGVGGIFLNRNHGPLLISNNFINMAGLINSGSGTEYVIGGITSHVAGFATLNPEYNIYHNTIILDSPAEEVGKHVGIGPITETVSGQYDIRNNIIVNLKDAGNSYALENFLSPTAEDGSSFESDYNNLSGNSNTGFWTGEARADLAAWQSASGLDANSSSVAVGFVSADSPRLDETSAQDENLHGTPIADVTIDFFGNDRDAENPFMGAHEGSAVDVSIPVDGDVPQQISLNQNYPNPFNPTTVISYELPSDQRVTLQVYTMQGQLVRTLVNDQHVSAGTHTVQFNAADLASGIYIYRLTAGEFMQSAKMTLIK